MCVGFVKEAVDGIFEFMQRAEYAALEPFLCEVGKEAFNGIEPRGGRRSEVEDEAWMFVDPFDDLRALVSGIVVDNDVDGLFLWHPGIDSIEEADELLMAMALHALAEDLALKDIESRKQGSYAMPLVIVGHGAGAAVLHRQPRLGAVQRLNLAFLVDRQHDSVVGRIDVETHDLLELGGKSRIIGQLELTHQMRSQAVSAPYPLHRTDADPCRLSHGRAGPVACRRRRSRQRHGHHALCHLGAQRWDARWPRLIAPKPRHTGVPEPLLPAPDHRLGFAGRLHNLGRATVIGSQKSDIGSPNVFLWAVAATTASSSRRLAAPNRMFLRSCIPQTRTPESRRESPSESKC